MTCTPFLFVVSVLPAIAGEGAAISWPERPEWKQRSSLAARDDIRERLINASVAQLDPETRDWVLEESLSGQQQLALVDCLAACDLLSPEIQEQAIELLRRQDPTWELTTLRLLSERLECLTPLPVLERLAERAKGNPSVEAHLVQLVRLARQEGRVSWCHQALPLVARAGGEALVREMLELVCDEEALVGFTAVGPLLQIAADDPTLVRSLVLERLDEDRPLKGEPQLAWAHDLLAEVAHPEALPYLLDYAGGITDGGRGAALGDELPKPLPPALLAIGKVGDMRACQFLQMRAGFGPYSLVLRIKLIEALSYVDPEVAVSLGLLGDLVDWLEEAESPPLKKAIVATLRMLTGKAIGPVGTAWRAYLESQELEEVYAVFRGVSGGGGISGPTGSGVTTSSHARTSPTRAKPSAGPGAPGESTASPAPTVAVSFLILAVLSGFAFRYQREQRQAEARAIWGRLQRAGQIALEKEGELLQRLAAQADGEVARLLAGLGLEPELHETPLWPKPEASGRVQVYLDRQENESIDHWLQRLSWKFGTKTKVEQPEPEDPSQEEASPLQSQQSLVLDALSLGGPLLEESGEHAESGVWEGLLRRWRQGFANSGELDRAPIWMARGQEETVRGWVERIEDEFQECKIASVSPKNAPARPQGTARDSASLKRGSSVWTRRVTRVSQEGALTVSQASEEPLPLKESEPPEPRCKRP